MNLDGQGAKTKRNHVLNITSQNEGAERGEMLISAPSGAGTTSGFSNEYPAAPHMSPQHFHRAGYPYNLMHIIRYSRIIMHPHGPYH